MATQKLDFLSGRLEKKKIVEVATAQGFPLVEMSDMHHLSQ